VFEVDVEVASERNVFLAEPTALSESIASVFAVDGLDEEGAGRAADDPANARARVPGSSQEPALASAEPSSARERARAESEPATSVEPAARAEAALEVVDSVRPPPVALDAVESLSPAQLENRASRAAERAGSRWMRSLAVAAAAALVLGLGAAWMKGRRAPAPLAAKAVPAAPAARPAEPAPAAAPERVAESAAAPAAPEPVPLPAAPAAPPQPELASQFAAALSKTSTSIAVTVQITPSGATIFEENRRLGRSAITTNIEPGKKKTLLALLDGYLPERFTIDGSVAHIAIELKPAAGDAKASAGARPAAAAPNNAEPGAQPKPSPKPAAPAEPFDPSRDVGAL